MKDYYVKDIGNFYGDNYGKRISINLRQIFSESVKRNMKSIHNSMVNLFVKTYIHETLHKEIFKVIGSRNREKYILGEEKVVAKMLGESWTKKDEYYYKGYFEKK